MSGGGGNHFEKLAGLPLVYRQQQYRTFQLLDQVCGILLGWKAARNY